MNHTILNDSIVFIFNYNLTSNALNLLEKFSKYFETLVLNTGEKYENSVFVNLDNIYYSGMVNECFRMTKEKNKKWVIFITSDVEIDDDNLNKMVENIKNLNDEKIGTYSPSVFHHSRAWGQGKNHKHSGLRDVYFVEGFFTMVKSDIIDEIYPIDMEINYLGHGIDLRLGFLSKKLGYKNVIDDGVIMHHPHGCGYNENLAGIQMKNWFKNMMDEDFNNFVSVFIQI